MGGIFNNMPPPIRPGRPVPNAPAYPAEGTELAFNAIVARFRAAPALARVAVHAWDGDAADNDPPADDSGPWLRFTPSPLASGYSNRSGGPVDRPVYAMPFQITIELSTPGTNPRDSMRLWGQLFAVLHPVTDADLAAFNLAMQAVGVESIEITRPAWGLSYSPGGNGAKGANVTRTYGVGSIDVSIRFGT
jgi:hypothetical protein